jgi:hypothetical protein
MYKTQQTLYFLFLEEYTNDFQVCVNCHKKSIKVSETCQTWYLLLFEHTNELQNSNLVSPNSYTRK